LGNDNPLMSRKTLILTEIIAPYRIPVFNALARRRELDLHVIFLAETDETARLWKVYRDEIRFSYEVLPSWRRRVGKTNVLVNKGVRSALCKARPQVIICGGYNYLASWQALWWARRRQVEFILWSESNRHDARSGGFWVESLKRSFLRRCDGFVVPGQASRDYLRMLGSGGKTIVTAPNAVDNDLFASEAGKARSFATEFRKKLDLPERFFLFVGRLVPEKGVFDLLLAYARLNHEVRKDIGLVFAGDGVSKDELIRRSKQVDAGRICFPGFAQRENLAGIYGMAAALILPTHSDPWGLVVNEAMACGLPVIVTKVAGCSVDLVEDGWNGYLVTEKNIEELSAAMNSVARGCKLNELMGGRAVRRIQSYSPEACASGLAAAAGISTEPE
jgi:1,2-diacylglycerol 3-alpha-glucosyltransferase